MSNFLPPGYRVPESPSSYMKFQDGLNSFRVLGSAITGFVYFNQDNKPVRSRVPFETVPSDIKKDGKVKHFWAFPVWNYQSKSVQVLEVTQSTIQNGISSLVNNPKWGDPRKFDIAITKTGESLDTEYTVQGEPPIAEPSKDILDAYKAKPVNLDALFDNGDPFAKPAEDRVSEVVNEEITF